ncbi:Vam7p LALA0_S06e07404g [Lachancea lanzarotensis]|uniref:LALA0S06e07404g1_1 n=1 Tax=Lachancea lanzarotensis TaxID=1245769 RepID=A0A0C7MSJ5_9SACH|nr:uncharacterized protein LALA0_S06e07404g [Lachancea lanzarotensis]CEP62940.1 LALA0S06e07404g1_1 [Lachancea lanzarotensis]
MGDLRVEVDINTVQIVKRQYALYRIDLTMVRSGGEQRQYHAFHRFSEFIKLRQDLENEMGSELPYELPGRNVINGWLKRTNSCDPDIIEHRKRELGRFLYDLLNDSFDSRWKKSPYVCHFLQIPSNWADATLRRTSNEREGDSTEFGSKPSLKDPQKWLEELRDCKILLAEAVRDRSSATKIGVKLRLRVQNLDISLKQIHQDQLVGTSEITRRRNLLNGLKTDLNEKLVERDSEWFNSVDDSRSEEINERPLQGRKIGETSQTLGLNDQELLQLHRDKTKSQDLELEKLRQIILSQKDLSISMNQELTQQNELLDLMSGEVDSTANKLRMANRGAKRVNEG